MCTPGIPAQPDTTSQTIQVPGGFQLSAAARAPGGPGDRRSAVESVHGLSSRDRIEAGLPGAGTIDDAALVSYFQRQGDSGSRFVEESLVDAPNPHFRAPRAAQSPQPQPQPQQQVARPLQSFAATTSGGPGASEGPGRSATGQTTAKRKGTSSLRIKLNKDAPNTGIATNSTGSGLNIPVA